MPYMAVDYLIMQNTMIWWEKLQSTESIQKPDLRATYLSVRNMPPVKIWNGKSQAALSGESSLPPFKPCLDKTCLLFPLWEPSTYGCRANSPSVHPQTKYITLCLPCWACGAAFTSTWWSHSSARPPKSSPRYLICGSPSVWKHSL